MMVVLYWVLHNTYTIIIKQKKYKVAPLLTFYIVTTMMILMYIYFEIYLWKITKKQNVFFIIMPIVLKFGLGLDQTWVNIELSVSFKHSLDTILNAELSCDYPWKFIKNGRFLVTVLIWTLIFAFAISLVIVELRCKRTAFMIHYGFIILTSL